MTAKQALKLSKQYKPPKYSRCLKDCFKLIKKAAALGDNYINVGHFSNIYPTDIDYDKLVQLGYTVVKHLTTVNLCLISYNPGKISWGEE